MINKQRVQRIKNLIYAFIILIMFLPIILMSILSFQMFGAIKDLNSKVDTLGKMAISQSSAAPAPSADGDIIEPEDQASKPADADDKQPEWVDSESEQGDITQADSPALNNENLTSSQNNVLSDSETQGGGELLQPEDEGNELGGGAPIDKSDDELLSVSGAGADASAGDSATQKELAGNPQMGHADETPPVDYTINPSTGA